jgi:hypothetical protein
MHGGSNGLAPLAGRCSVLDVLDTLAFGIHLWTSLLVAAIGWLFLLAVSRRLPPSRRLGGLATLILGGGGYFMGGWVGIRVGASFEVDEAVLGSAAFGMALGLVVGLLCSRAITRQQDDRPDLSSLPADFASASSRWGRGSADPRRLITAHASSAWYGARQGDAAASPPSTPSTGAGPLSGESKRHLAASTKCCWLLVLLLAVVSAISLGGRLAGYHFSWTHGVRQFSSNESTVVDGNLQITVLAVHWDGDLVSVDYELRWRDDRAIFGRPWTSMDAAWWDDEGVELPGDRTLTFLDRDSATHRRTIFQGNATFRAPKGAAYVSIGLSAEAMTKRVAIPPRKEMAENPKEKAEKAIQAIKQLGGKVARDEKAARKPIVAVDLSMSEVADPDLGLLKDLGGVRSLDLSTTKVTDAGVEELQDLPHLQTLALSFTRVTDAGLQSLKGLENLRRLDLRGTEVTREGVADLRRALPGLKVDHD